MTTKNENDPLRLICGEPFTTDDERRFWAKVDLTGGGELTDCWPWAAAKSGNRYGYFWLNGEARGAHKIAYELVCGPVPEGMLVRHGPCANKRCVNPSHLTVGTKAQNEADTRLGWWREGIPLSAWPISPRERETVNALLAGLMAEDAEAGEFGEGADQ